MWDRREGREGGRQERKQSSEKYTPERRKSPAAISCFADRSGSRGRTRLSQGKVREDDTREEKEKNGLRK